MITLAGRLVVYMYGCEGGFGDKDIQKDNAVCGVIWHLA